MDESLRLEKKEERWSQVICQMPHTVHHSRFISSNVLLMLWWSLWEGIKMNRTVGKSRIQIVCRNGLFWYSKDLIVYHTNTNSGPIEAKLVSRSDQRIGSQICDWWVSNKLIQKSIPRDRGTKKLMEKLLNELNNCPFHGWITWSV